MNIEIFNQTITDSILTDLQITANTYKGLYADMDNPSERKFVKDQAADINSLLKQVDRKRIDLSRDYKITVEAEAERITEALKEANRPFTLLIDEYAAKRKEILAEKKDREDARDLIIKIIENHADAIELNTLYDLQADERQRQQEERDNVIREEAAKKAEADMLEKIERDNAVKKKAEERELFSKRIREADVEHRREFNSKAVDCLLSECNLDVKQAREVIKAISKGLIDNIRIRY